MAETKLSILLNKIIEKLSAVEKVTTGGGTA